MMSLCWMRLFRVLPRGQGWRTLTTKGMEFSTRLWALWLTPTPARSRRGWVVRPPEALEGRALLATAGYDYIQTGYTWSNPAHITYSIAPDGVYWDHGVNNLNAVFNAKFGQGVWQREIARALATWESVANINIGQVTDSPYDMNTPGLSQGDPRFGDIRFGGYAFPNNTTTLAQSYSPPPDGGTESGDVEVNTAMPWAIGSNFDFYSVMLHETGLTLGLGEPPSPSVVMNRVYGGVRQGLTSGDIAGIQAIYGPRTQDVYQAQGQGLSQASAINVTGDLNGAGLATVSGVSLATIGDTEYFRVTAPAGATGGLQVTALTSGLSLLSPKVSVYNASGQLLDVASNPSAYGDNVTAGASGVTPGQTYVVAVTGATGDVFSVGAYVLAVHVNVSTTAPVLSAPIPAPTLNPTPAPPVLGSPVVSPPSSTFTPEPGPVLNPAPVIAAPVHSTPGQAIRLGMVAHEIAAPLAIPAGSGEFFAFQNARAGVYLVGAAGTDVRVVDAYGNTIASGSNLVGINVFRPRSTLFVEVSSPSGAAVGSGGLGIVSVASASQTVFTPHHLAPSFHPTWTVSHAAALRRARAGLLVRRR